MRPPWVEEIVAKYSSAISVGFILYLNIDDYVEPGVTLKKYLAKIFADREIAIFYNRAKGIEFAGSGMREKFCSVLGLEPDLITRKIEIPKAPAGAMPLIEKILRMTSKEMGDILGTKVKENKAAAVIIEYAESLVPAADMAMMIPDDRNILITIEGWAKDPDIINAGNAVFLVTTNLSDIHQAIRTASSKYEAIRIPMPNLELRQEFIDRQLGEKGAPISEMDAGAVARATAGLSLINIEDIFLRAKREGSLTWELIKERKKEIMRSEFNDVLEIMEPRYGFEAVGGLQNIKDYFLRNVIEPMKSGDYGSVAMGVLLLGPPGTGKTILCEAVAKESGMNMAILNLAKIYSKWVGDSERNLEKALAAIDSLIPIIVFIDEIDAALPNRDSGGNGDSGVSARIFKRMLEYMSDGGHRGKTIFIGASNRPDNLDAALKRPGRFDTKIPLLIPDDKSRLGIFEVMTKKYEVPLKEIQAKWITSTKGWTGAEIEKLMIKARTLMRAKKLDPVMALEEAFTYIIPKTEDIERMSRLAVECADDLEFVPKEWWPNARQTR